MRLPYAVERLLVRESGLDEAGITTQICNHSWRATAITVFLENGGALEAQYMAGVGVSWPNQSAPVGAAGGVRVCRHLSG